MDATGAVQKRYTYDVYGKPTVTGTMSNEFDFAGQETDPSTGLHYLRARHMDPATRRFMSREPMALDPGWIGNSFAFGAGNPVQLTDPSGLYPVDASGCRVDRPDPACGDESELPPNEGWPGLTACHGGPVTAAPCLGPRPRRQARMSKSGFMTKLRTCFR